MSVSHVTTHILDTARGRPAADVGVELAVRDDGLWAPIADARTDADGRARELGPETLEPGDYRLTFATGAYFAGQSIETFFPEVALAFTLADTDEHYHVPLLISPFAYSTYRGS